MAKIIPAMIICSLALTPLLLPTSFIYAAGGDFAFVGGIIIVGVGTGLWGKLGGPAVIVVKPTSPEMASVWAVAGLIGPPCTGNLVLGYGYKTSHLGITFGVFVVGMAAGLNLFC
ncbi:MAG: hypothetical protein AAB474_00200 [Patescibacteria group bacterium]